MIAFIRRYPLAAFFIGAYLGSWLFWSPMVLIHGLPFGVVALINQLGLFAGPFASALVVTRIIGGKEAVKPLLASMLQWRVRPVWYLLAVIMIPVATAAGYFVVSWQRIELLPLQVLVTLYVVYLLGGPLQEEIGWRGFALLRLQTKFAPVVAALLLGVVHCLWHAPLFLTTEWDTARDSPDQYLAYLLLVLSMSIIMSWLYNGSQGSVLLAILGHNGINWALTAVGASTTWPAAGGMVLLASISIVITKGQLGVATR